MLAEAQAAREAVDRVSAEPRGVIKVSCPVALSQDTLAHLVPEFLRQFPQVRLQLHVSNRRVDVIQEGFDVALRVRTRLHEAHLAAARAAMRSPRSTEALAAVRG